MDKKSKLFTDIDFTSIENNPDFKEQSVRSQIINHILTKLGYKSENIVEEKGVQIQSGSKKQLTTIYADYVLKIGEHYICTIEAKSPNKTITEEHIEQAFSYASNIAIRSNYFVLCNGLEFYLFKTDLNRSLLLHFHLSEIDNYLDELANYLSVDSFKKSDGVNYFTIPKLKTKAPFDYSNRPLLNEIPVHKAAAKRHYGVHGYFTKQSWNVVREYIKNYTQPGDLVLDPFGGSGITAIEAMMCDRRGINIDLNPMAVFIVQSLIAPINQEELAVTFEQVKKEYLKKEPKTKEEIEKVLEKYKLPKDLLLPKGSDVKSVLKLFTKQQLAQLTLLKAIIKKQKNKNIKKSMLLMFSGIIGRANKTWYCVGGEFGGGESVFRYYRYRIAPEPSKLNIIKYFELRYKRILAAKEEMKYFINEETIDDIQVIKGTATDLSFIPNESVDYIYTDPPYGKKIPYLDLSAMWNAWLDLDVTEEDYELEAIEGGEHNKSKESYNNLISKSIQEMYRVLKFDRWLSFVFAHKDPEFWHLIIDAAERCGFEYVGAVAQKNGQTSFKKRQKPFTVLSGQLIINFRKVRNPKTIMKANLGMNITEIVMQTIEGIIAKNNGATLEQINDELISKGLEVGFLDLLKKEYSDLTPLLLDNFDYKSDTELYTMRKNSKFTAHIDINLRIKYYLVSYLRRMEREKKLVSFDEIVYNIMPLLKNGTTPEQQTILNILESVATKVGENGWKLNNGELF